MIQRRKNPKKNIPSETTSKPDDNLPVQTRSIEELASAVITHPSIDRVNDIEQKEVAMSQAGVTRRKVYEHISSLLSAVVETREYDKDSKEWITTTVPDVEKRTKGTELALKAFGDLKEMQKVNVGSVHNKVVYQWLSAPSANVVAVSV